MLPAIPLGEGERPGSPAGQLVGIVTELGNFTNPNYDPAIGSCANAAGENPVEGEPGDPVALIGDGES